MPIYFPFIQSRQGYLLNDVVLEQLPKTDVSLPVFLLIWGAGLLILVRSIAHPALMVRFLWAYAIVTIFRALTIYFIPLEPPVGWVSLQDPLTNFFYGKAEYVTKDLFFSGHTSTVVLIYFVLERRLDKLLTLLASIAVGVLLAVQHIHYTIDIVAAPIGTYVAYLLGKRLAAV